MIAVGECVYGLGMVKENDEHIVMDSVVRMCVG